MLVPSFVWRFVLPFIEAHRIRVFAGAGIVAGSQPLEEWKEIERKAAGLISLFAEEK